MALITADQRREIRRVTNQEIARRLTQGLPWGQIYRQIASWAYNRYGEDVAEAALNGGRYVWDRITSQAGEVFRGAKRRASSAISSAFKRRLVARGERNYRIGMKHGNIASKKGAGSKFYRARRFRTGGKRNMYRR